MLAVQPRITRSEHIVTLPVKSKPYTNITAKFAVNHALAGKVTEIVVPDKEPQTLAMLLPLLTQLSFDQRWLLWLTPPAGLAKPMLQQADIDLNKVMLLNADIHHSTHNLACRALQTGTSHLVISTENGFDAKEMAELKDAARLGQSHAIVIRYC